jgi:uncharacterized protein (DUF1697 family)
MSPSENRVNSYIALLRGINVGGRNSLPMKELVAIFQSLAHKNIQTYIQSGNVVFQSEHKLTGKDCGEIGKAIFELKDFEPQVMILTEETLLSAIEENPYPTDIGKALHFFFLDSKPASPDFDRLLNLKAESEEITLKDSVFYLHAPEGIGRSKLAAVVEKALGVPGTGRNWNTVHKLAEMIKGLPQ